jgi:hypothetical protein
MNAKLKTILTTAWNEPRAFFLWLTLGSALLFGSAALFVHTKNMERVFSSPVPPAVQMIALLSLFCLGVSFVCFFLAWIPPLRRLFAWLLQRRFFVLACLGTLIALFYAVENWRGRHAWASFQREWAAKGERFDLASVIPPTVPDDENFFMTKPWEQLRLASTNRTTQWDDIVPAVLDAYGTKGQAPGLGDMARAKRTDLGAWQEFYRGTNNLIAAGDGAFTNYFPVAAHPQSPAQDVLLALTRYEDTLRQLYEAAKRPHARVWVNYEDGFAVNLSHLAKIKGCASYLSIHAIASLANGDADTALADVLLSCRLNEALTSEPFLITHLVRAAVGYIQIIPIWEGLADQRWSDPQLARLDAALAKEDYLENYQQAMRGERACFNHTFDQIRQTRNLDFLGEPEAVAQAEGSLLEQTLGNSLFRLVPGGWFDQNKLSVSRINVEVLLTAVDVEHGIAAPAAVHRTDEESRKRSRAVTPYNLFSHTLLPALSRSAEKCGRAQSMVDLARVAIALERHRLANGQFPETLAALEPKFIAKLPHDVINGQPLKYRRTDNDSFILYSVGWNEKDDGGTVAFSKDGKNVNWKEGDWVWRYPQP